MLCHSSQRIFRLLSLPLLVVALGWLPGVARTEDSTETPPDTFVPRPERHPLLYIDTAFENASPLFWDFSEDGTVYVHLMYDHERGSPNRAAGHWHFRVEAEPGSRLTLVLMNFDNVWNGQLGSPVSQQTIAFLSEDRQRWEPIEGEFLRGNRLRLAFHVPDGDLYVARLPTYTTNNLRQLIARVKASGRGEVSRIGESVEGRPLEMLHFGPKDAPHGVLLRARSHPWEPGGNWVIEGLVNRLLSADAATERLLAECRIDILPMANIDGVVHGRTRFNMRGMDLNRNWHEPADPELCPENAALEAWLTRQKDAGRLPDLAIDLHNDESGKLHISRPDIPDLDAYLARMQRLETLLRKHTWFTEGSTGGSFRNPGTLGEGLLERYGVDACILELNANRIAGLGDFARAENWERFGHGLCDVFRAYFAEQTGKR